MTQLSIITVFKDPGSDLTKTEDSVLREFGSSPDIEYIQKEWSPEPELTESNKDIDGKLPCRHIRGRDAGVFDGMLQALGYANGEWVLYLNAGDWLAEGFAQEFQKTLNRAKGVGYIYFNGVTVDCQDGREFPRVAPDALKLPDFLHRGPVLHPCLVVRRDVMLRYGFDLQLDLAADFDLMVRLVHDGVAGKHVSEVGAFVLSGGLSERRRVRARLQATRSLWKHTRSAIGRLQIVTAFARFLFMHTLIVGIVHRLPALRKWLHARRGKQDA